MPLPADPKITRKQLIEGLNEDLSREYQAIISYVVYSQVLKGAAYMNIADELQVHAGEELSHALTIANQIAEDMLRFDLDNENETVRNYRERIRQCEAVGEFAIAEHIREIL